MKIGKCLKCDAVGQVTEDHVIPEWFLKAVGNFGLKKPENRIEMICNKCNSAKGGKIDFSDTESRELGKQIVISLVEKIRKFEEFIF